MAMLLTMFAHTHNITVAGNSLEQAGQEPRNMLINKVQKPLKTSGCIHIKNQLDSITIVR